MKLYQLEDNHLITIDSNGTDTLLGYLAVFDLAEGQSTFSPRYSVVDGVLIDNFIGKTDEEVMTLLQQPFISLTLPSIP